MGALRSVRLRRNGRRSRGGPGWLLAGLRAVVLVAAVYGLVHCPSWVEESYRATVTYRNAPLCAAGQEPDRTTDDCVEQTTGRIVAKGTRQSCTTDSNGLQSCTTYYSVEVRHPQGADSLDVEAGTYRDVDRGDPAELRLWDGAVVRMETGGHTETYLAPSEYALLWRLAGTWFLLGMAVAALAVPVAFGFYFAGGWVLLAVSAMGVAYGLLFGTLAVWEWLLMGVLSVPGLWCWIHGWLETRDW